ncbi:uncharacterized protein LOC106642542 [Copidosoma floridanum]|uniref:uncharacterized protein LOC106642542 n=1 Tax=Copidosoma floridanum TaxID=29053 RepID=UPI0006C9484C|nr:uncharacterized protein LOC106642542 [Copidosoma floridanum]
MASREKRALAPSKSRQKANNDSSTGNSFSPTAATESSTPTGNNRVRKLTAAQLRLSSQQLVVTNQSLRGGSGNSHQVAAPRDSIFEVVATSSQLPVKIEAASLPRKRAALQTALKRKQRARKTLIKVKQKQQQVITKAGLKRIAAIEAKIGGLKGRRRNNNALVDAIEETKYKCKTTKKNKTLVKAEVHRSEDQTSPKLSRRVLNISQKGKKSVKAVTPRKQKNILEQIKKESEIIQIKQEIKSDSEDEVRREEQVWDDNVFSINDTIEEVIASSMLVEPNVAHIKVEESEGKKNARNATIAKRSLRNGKLLQTTVKVETDSAHKRINMSEAGVESGLESKPVNLDVEGVFVKVEAQASEDENFLATNNHCGSESSEHETNNNGFDENSLATTNAEMGPTLRSKTKARNSDSSSETGEDIKPTIIASNKIVDMDLVKKERTHTKLTEVRSSSAAQNNATLKGRRSSLNIDVRRNPLCNEKLSGKDLDDMVSQIKFNISKAIESKVIFKPENKTPVLLAKNFDVKVEEVVASLSNDSTQSRLDEDTEDNAANNRDLGIGPSLTNKELNSEDTENSVPRVADTAKEIEKLVMGDIESVDSKPSEDNDKPLVDATTSTVAAVTVAAAVIVAVAEPAEVEKKQTDKDSSAESCDNLEKDKQQQQPESTKKATICIKRKSPRSGKSGSSDIKKQRLCKEPKEEATEAEKEKEEVAETTIIEASNNTLDSEITNEGHNIEDKTAVPAMKEPTEAANSTEPLVKTKSNASSEKMIADLNENKNKCGETLESLSREVERLVEADDGENQKVKVKLIEIDENEMSSDEMRLVIDDSVFESVSEAAKKEPTSCQPQTNANKEGCDQGSTTERSSDVQKVDGVAVESTNVGVRETPGSGKTDADSDAKSESKATKASKSVETGKVEEQRETTRRSLRTRGDKQKKVEITKPVPTAHDKSDKKSEDAATSAEVPSNNTQSNVDSVKNSQKVENDSLPSDVVIKEEPKDQPQEPIIRTRRSREVKRTPVVTKSKRSLKKQEPKKTDSHQNKEDSLLDNEVAKINENNRRPPSYLQCNDSLRVVSANADSGEQKHADAKNRSKSENDLASSSAITAEDVAIACSEAVNTDEGSTDGDSSSSAEPIQESPEDRAKKEAVLRQLGLESWERVKEREAKKGVDVKSESPKQQSSGSLKTVIRLQKEKESKKRPRSPIKMVFNKQGRVDGEESSEFYQYTIQKETESTGLGESSSGANRKLPTNPRHSSDNADENEEAPLKDRQSLVIPEKSSSFSIHPERLCSDNCCYCYGKFGSLDTPMHLAQMKSDERRNKILVIETHITPDSCLCDACYRHIDRKANASPTTLLMKLPRRNTHFQETKCIVQECNAPVKSHVKRRWLVKIKRHLMERSYLDKVKDKKEDEVDRRDEDIKWKVNIDWKAAQHNLVPFCESHYNEIACFLKCVLCQRRLPRNSYFFLPLTESTIKELHPRIWEMGIPTVIYPDSFYCKLCKFFMKLILQPLDSLSENNRHYLENYGERIGNRYTGGCVSEEEGEQELSVNQSDRKRKDRPDRLSITITNKKFKPNRKRSKSPIDRIETLSTSASDKSTPEPPHHDVIEPEVTIKEEGSVVISSIANTESRCMSIEGAIEKLKKRKNLDTLGPTLIHQNPSDVMQILTKDKEVTLTVLPKKSRLDVPSNDITPVVQRLGNNPSISVRTLFPGEEEMNLQAGVEFNNVREVTPQGWEKCMTVVQYDRDTKLLWQELQRPYGNMSSFLRHLVLLEKYYRSGDLILAPNASRNAINYSTSVQNRLISYEGPEKMDEPMSVDPTVDLNNSRRLSGGYILENRSYVPQHLSTSSSSSSIANIPAQLSKLEHSSSKVLKLTPMVSITKKPPSNLQRPNASGSDVNGSAKRKETIPIQKVHGGSNTVPLSGKMIQLSEPDFRKYQNLKRQKQIMNVKQSRSNLSSSSGSTGQGSYGKPSSVYIQKAQQLLAQQHQQSQFQKHLRMQQEMYAQRSRSDFEPLVCDRLANENTPTQNYIHTLNLPKSIQVTTKTTSTSGSAPTATSTPIPILPKIPKSLTVIPQTVSRIQQGHDK